MNNNSNNLKEMSWEEIAHKLWDLLDNISTCGDIYKPDQTGYFKAVSKQCGLRSQYLTSDGYNLFPVVKIKDKE